MSALEEKRYILTINAEKEINRTPGYGASTAETVSVTPSELFLAISTYLGGNSYSTEVLSIECYESDAEEDLYVHGGPVTKEGLEEMLSKHLGKYRNPRASHITAESHSDEE